MPGGVSDYVEGVVYTLKPEQVKTLDGYEGYRNRNTGVVYQQPGYRPQNITLADGTVAMTYIATATDNALKPSMDYMKNLLIARKNGYITNAYFQKLLNTPVQESNTVRDHLIPQQIQAYQPQHQAKLQKTTQDNTIDDRSFKNSVFFSIFSYLLIAGNPFIAINPILSVASGIFFGLLSYFRVKFQTFSANNFYNAPEQINKIKSISEKDAFIGGVEAKSWKGYFSSFMNYKAYLYPMAFGAGLSQAMNNRNKIVTQVKNLKIK